MSLGMARPAAIVFDVIETLFPLDPLKPRLAALGLAPGELELLFTRILRDAFALSAAGSWHAFRDIASGSLQVLLAQRGLAPGHDEVDAVLDAFRTLEAAPDAAPALRLVERAGVRAATLSNGGVDATRALLERADLGELVSRVLGVDEIRRYKPGPEIYRHAAEALGFPPGRLALVAVHAWDCEGAKRVGFVTGWSSRLERRFHPAMAPPDATGPDLVSVVEGLLSL
jgi:2-haloacid dehalogenase